MAENFYTILTNIGMAAIANAQVSQSKVDFASIAVGDSNGSYYSPAATATKLVNEVWRGSINAISIDETNPNWIIVEAVIPATIGGFSVREIGVFDTSGALLAIGKIPETYKPAAEQGSLKDLYLRIILEVSNASSITLKVDPAVIYASKKYVDDKVSIVASGLENVQQQTAAIDTNLDTHIEIDDGHVRFIGDAVGTNAKTITTDKLFLENAPPIRPKIGASFRFRNGTHNTGTVSLQIVSAKYGTTTVYPVYNSRGEALKSGDLKGQLFYTVVFTGTSFQLQGEGGGYGTSDLIKAQDLINRDYIQTNLKGNLSGYYRWDSTLVATVNGIELGFAYRASTRDTTLYCWETRTGFMRYTKTVKYEYLGSMMVVGDKLYICYRDYDGVITGGIGIEMMNAMSGSQLSVDRVPSVTGFENVRDTCVQVYGGATSILIGAGYSNYEFIARFDVNGKYVSVSANWYSYLYTNDYPYWMTTINDRIYVGTFKAVYWFTFGFVYGGRLAEAAQPYTYGGIAPNNIGGLAVLTNGAITQYTPSLGVVTAISVVYNGTGLGSTGDYLAFYTDLHAVLYKMSADGKSAYPEASHEWLAGFKLSSPARCLGFSENAFVLGSYDTFNVLPAVVTRTLKVIR